MVGPLVGKYGKVIKINREKDELLNFYLAPAISQKEKVFGQIRSKTEKQKNADQNNKELVRGISVV